MKSNISGEVDTQTIVTDNPSRLLFVINKNYEIFPAITASQLPTKRFQETPVNVIYYDLKIRNRAASNTWIFKSSFVDVRLSDIQ